ncbi:conserved hypothetical protein [uncultured Desulfobacterium sp.]|uniref:Thymidylate synthase n=1 Tax=uncultured Desulfobacterium sp. TaxID=201089 RepID=A0A445N0Q4_9BACT|nr:conserved hypothetical protein [uncultured Desulfobacterium sp.]
MIDHKQKILVFQQNDSGESKIRGVRKYGKDHFSLEIISIDTPLSQIIDEPQSYLPLDFNVDLVLDYLRHPDLSCALAQICAEKNITIVASGKKLRNKWAFTPTTCCGLSRHAGLGVYGERFGAPEFDVTISEGKIADVKVLRGAPCGATWEAVKRLKGVSISDAALRIGLETQFFCSANPAGWDPISGKSPVHFAGQVHCKALGKALEKRQ